MRLSPFSFFFLGLRVHTCMLREYQQVAPQAKFWHYSAGENGCGYVSTPFVDQGFKVTPFSEVTLGAFAYSLQQVLFVSSPVPKD